MDVDQTIEYLNILVKQDPKIMTELIEFRVPCLSEFGEGTNVVTLAVGEYGQAVGLLGIINGMFPLTSSGCGQITAVLDDNNLITCFKRTEAPC